MLSDLLKKKDFVILDGAMGTVLQSNGMKIGENPMLINIDRPDDVVMVHRAYSEAGCDIIYTNTLGASDRKLSGTGYTSEQVVTAATVAAKKVDNVLVALDVGPIGDLLEPHGSFTFDDAYEQFRRQVVAGAQAGADLVAIETMSDLGEVRAALLAVKENSDLPVIVTMTFESGGRTFMGCLPESFAAVCQGLGADAIGLNCSVGPGEAKSILERIAKITTLPVVFKPNAGMPDPVTGDYNLTPAEFARLMAGCIPSGVSIVGGCCGTTPEYIKALREEFADKTPVNRVGKNTPAVCSPSKYLPIDGVMTIGERINPTGKKMMQKALLERDMDYIMSQAIEQTEAGVHILDVNVGMPEGDEPSLMVQAVRSIQSVSNLPLQIDSSDITTLEAGLRAFNGKGIINSINGKRDVLERVLPLARKYGAAVIGLTLDEGGIPEQAADRLKIAEKILASALSYGIPKEDLYIDCLALTVSTKQSSAAETLKAVKMVKEKLGLKTVLGISNISFGLPKRDLINSSFLTLALECGLDMPIINPNSRAMGDTVTAYNLLNCRDIGGKEYIERFSPRKSQAEYSPLADMHEGGKDMNQAVINGLASEAADMAKKLLNEKTGMEILDEILIPALDLLGDKYETGDIFLPQLLNGAAAAGEAIEVIKKNMPPDGNDSNRGTIVIATVQGDIHDIGKNIVKTVLENYGYRMIDLGKDVPPDKIVKTAIENSVELVGLSALMTTTLVGMEDTIKALRASGHQCKIMVGGAVLTEEYALRIGADYYARDARESAIIAREVFGA